MAPSPTRGFLSRPLSRTIWLAVVGVALALSGWSIYWIGLKFGVPRGLALFGSVAFDGATVAFCDYSVRHVSAGTRGGGFARGMSLLLLAASITLNATHALVSGHGPVAAVYFAMPAVVAVTMLEAHFRWLHSGLRPPAQAKTELPSFHLLTWLTHPGDAWQRIKAAAEPGRNPAELVPSVPELFTIVPELPRNSSGTLSGGSVASPDLGIVGDSRTVRTWARDHGVEVGAHGPIPAHVEEAWRRATVNAGSNGHGPEVSS